MLIGVPGTGDPDRDPALKGLNDTDCRLESEPVSTPLDPGLIASVGRADGREPRGGDSVSDPGGLAARSAEIGLDPRGGAMPW